MLLATTNSAQGVLMESLYKNGPSLTDFVNHLTDEQSHTFNNTNKTCFFEWEKDWLARVKPDAEYAI